MSMTSRIFVLDGYMSGSEIIIVGLNDVLSKVEFNVGYANSTYCVVFDEDAFTKLLANYTESNVSVEKLCIFSASNKSIFDAMLLNEPLVRPAVLVQLSVLTNMKALLRFLRNNDHHTNIFNYSRFFDKPLNTLAMAYSIKKGLKRFKFQTIINHYCLFKGQQLIDVLETDDWPLKKLPLVVMDLEVVATRLETFPLGLKTDEQITHLAVVVEYQQREFVYVLVVQGAHPIAASKSSNKLILPVACEKDLLKQFAVDFMSHKFLRAFGLPKTMAFLLSGYNIDNFDLPFLYARFIHHGLVDLANLLHLHTGISENAFSFDLWHAEHRVFAGIQNCSLKKVSQMFLDETKLPLNVMAIRKLYNGDHLELDLQRPADVCYYNKDGSVSQVPTVSYFIDYNIQDCRLIPKLFNKQGVLDLLQRMCVLCNLPYYEAIACGNSKRLENLMIIFALNQQSWLVPISNIHLHYNELDDLLHQLQDIDSKSKNLNHVTQLCRTYLATREELGDYEDTELCLVKSTKGFSGGANDARRHIGRYVFGLDAESFYPSIIKEFNLDLNNVLIIDKADIPYEYHTTFCKKHHVFAYEGSKSDVIDTSNWQWPRLEDLNTYNGLVLIIFKTNSMLKDLVQQLLDDRKECKELLKQGYSSTVKAKELTYKTMSCCVFGVLGYKEFRFERIFVAAAITFLARHLLRFCIHELSKLNVKIVYVDTDGIMCHTPTVQKQADVDALSVFISRKVGFPCIRFKPESIYDFCNVLSCKKYITLDHGQLTFKGFEKNAVPPVKELLKAWFGRFFDELHKYPYNSYAVKVHGPDLLLAAFSYLHGLDYPIDEWSVTKTVTEHTSSIALTNFFRFLIEQGTAVGDRINLLPILDEHGDEVFCLTEFYAGQKLNYKFLMRNYIQYLVSFSNIEATVITNRSVDVVWQQFLEGKRLGLHEVKIHVEAR